MLELFPTEIRHMIIRNLFNKSLRMIPEDFSKTQDLTFFTFKIDKIWKERNYTEADVYHLAKTSAILRRDIIYILDKHIAGLQALLQMESFLEKMPRAEQVSACTELKFCDRLVRQLVGARYSCGTPASFDEKRMEWYRKTGGVGRFFRWNYRLSTTTVQKGAIHQGWAVCAPIPRPSRGTGLQDIHNSSMTKAAWRLKVQSTLEEPRVRVSGNGLGWHGVDLDPAGRPGRASEDGGLSGTNSHLLTDSPRNVLHAENKTSKITPAPHVPSKLQQLIDSIGKGPGMAAP